MKFCFSFYLILLPNSVTLTDGENTNTPWVERDTLKMKFYDTNKQSCFSETCLYLVQVYLPLYSINHTPLQQKYTSFVRYRQDTQYDKSWDWLGIDMDAHVQRNVSSKDKFLSTFSSRCTILQRIYNMKTFEKGLENKRKKWRRYCWFRLMPRRKRNGGKIDLICSVG